MLVRAAGLVVIAALLGAAPAEMRVRPSRTVVAPVTRIVSLVPSLTEDLFALGAGGRIVGVSSYADFPRAARALPVVASFSSVNSERIVALHPDLILGIPSQAALLRDLGRTRIRIMLLKDDTLDDLYQNLTMLGLLAGREPQATELVARLKARTVALARAAASRRSAPSVFVVLGTSPIFTVGRGSYIARLIALAGGRNASAGVGPPYARYSAEALIANQPDVLVVDPDIHFADVVGKAPWTSLRAVREHRVFMLPDAAILERPGPRYNQGLAWLIGIMSGVKAAPAPAAASAP